MTMEYRSSEKIDVTLTLRPAATSARTAATPDAVAGTATSRLGRSMRWYSRRAAATAPRVRLTIAGAISTETKPSPPWEVMCTGRRTAQAAWTSVATSSR